MKTTACAMSSGVSQREESSPAPAAVILHRRGRVTRADETHPNSVRRDLVSQGLRDGP